jgi:uncharacterized membrane protein
MFTVAILFAPVVAWGQQSLTIIDYPGANLTVAMGINPKGDIVGFYRDPAAPVTAGKIHGFVLGKGGFATIDYPGAWCTDAWAINAAGDIVGTYYPKPASGVCNTGPGQHGYLLRKGRFTSIDVPGSTFTGGYGINSEGDIVGHYGVPPLGKMNGFLFRNGEFTTYDHTPANQMTCGMGINPEGQIVGHYQDAVASGGLIHGFLLNEGVFTTIDIPGGKNVQAYGINPEGEIVGFYTELGTTPAKIHGFVLDPWGVVTQVDVPGAVNTWVRRNNPRGDLVGNYTQVVDGVTTTHGFLMTAR